MTRDCDLGCSAIGHPLNYVSYMEVNQKPFTMLYCSGMGVAPSIMYLYMKVSQKAIKSTRDCDLDSSAILRSLNYVPYMEVNQKAIKCL